MYQLASSTRILPPPTSFLAPIIGRTEEIAFVTHLLGEARHRLVTLTGPGGVGKTRLAQHLGEILAPAFSDGVVFVPLAAIHDANHVLTAIAQTLGLTEQDEHTSPHTLRQWFAHKEMLLILDNLEQVIAVGPQLIELLVAAPHLSILLTSQTMLNLLGEQIVPIQPLALPDTGSTHPEQILRSEAVQLFVERAGRLSPAFAASIARNAESTAVSTTSSGVIAVIGEICRQLDGLPLAIELAAARTNILSPEALLARLTNQLQLLASDRQDIPDRHRTMRQAIAWSYNLLPSPEQRLFRYLSVFSGGISLEAIEAIPDPAVDLRSTFSTLDLLKRLIDHSLIQSIPLPSGEIRFLMLETIRAYGQERLVELGEAESARLTHAMTILRLSQEIAPQLDTVDRDGANDRIERDWENIRTAIAWAFATDRPALALRIASGVWYYCEIRGHIAEGRQWHEQALAEIERVQNDGDRYVPADYLLSPEDNLAVRLSAGFLAEDQNDAPAAEKYLGEALTLARALGNHHVEIQALIGLGLVAHDRNEFDESRVLLSQASDLARKTGEPRLEAFAENCQGRRAIFQTRHEEARTYFESARRIARQLADSRLEALYTTNLAVIAIEEDDLDLAEDLSSQALSLHQSMNDRRSVALSHINLGEINLHRGNLITAETHLSDALEIIRTLEEPGREAIILNDLAAIAVARGMTKRAASQIAFGLSRARQIGDPFSFMLLTEQLTRVAIARQRWEDAALLLAIADTFRERLDVPRNVRDTQNIQHLRQTIAAARGEAASSRRDEVKDTGLVEGTVRVEAVARDIEAQPESRASSESPSHGLTPRELDVLTLLVHGASTQEIADRLSISTRTVTTHVGNIFGKFDVSSRAAAVAHALRSNIV